MHNGTAPPRFESNTFGMLLSPTGFFRERPRRDPTTRGRSDTLSERWRAWRSDLGRCSAWWLGFDASFTALLERTRLPGFQTLVERTGMRGPRA